MPEILLSFDIRNHNLTDLHYFRDLFNGLRVREYHVYITKERIRTIDSNAYYWGVVLDMISEETGHTVLDLHKHFKLMFNAKGKSAKNGNVLVFGGSTKRQNTIRFNRYISEIRLWALYFLDLTIPEPVKLTEEQKLKAVANHG